MADEAAAMPKGIDISSEEERVYTFPDGAKFTIKFPKTLYIGSGSHRVVDQAGMTHRPERGYVGISWLPKLGEPAFVA